MPRPAAVVDQAGGDDGKGVIANPCVKGTAIGRSGPHGDAQNPACVVPLRSSSPLWGLSVLGTWAGLRSA